ELHVRPDSIGGDRRQSASNDPERRVPTDGRQTLTSPSGLPAGGTRGEAGNAAAPRQPHAPRAAAAIVAVRLGIVGTDGEPTALGTVPHRHAEPLRGCACYETRSKTERTHCAACGW